MISWRGSKRRNYTGFTAALAGVDHSDDGDQGPLLRFNHMLERMRGIGKIVGDIVSPIRRPGHARVSDRLLLGTHIGLWMSLDPSRIKGAARKRLVASAEADKLFVAAI